MHLVWLSQSTCPAGYGRRFTSRFVLLNKSYSHRQLLPTTTDRKVSCHHVRHAVPVGEAHSIYLIAYWVSALSSALDQSSEFPNSPCSSRSQDLSASAIRRGCWWWSWWYG